MSLLPDRDRRAVQAGGSDLAEERALGEALLFDTKGVEALVCTPPSSEPDAYPSHVYWLNPEPRSYWDTGDSIVSEYGAHIDGVFEVRNLTQLERFVDHLV